MKRIYDRISHAIEWGGCMDATCSDKDEMLDYLTEVVEQEMKREMVYMLEQANSCNDEELRMVIKRLIHNLKQEDEQG